MDFSDEHYVRIYTRDTKTWLKWGWEGETVFMFVMRKMDKAGVLDGIDDPAADVALLTGLPIAVVEAGLPRILKSGTFELANDRLICPKYIEGQTAKKSDRQRAQEFRERRRDKARTVTARDEPVTECDADITDCDETVTRNNGASQRVTLCSAVQCSTDQDPPVVPPSGGPHEAPDTKPGEPEKRKPKRKARGSLPDDWEPKPNHRERAAELRLDVQAEAERFRLHAAQTGRLLANWDAGFTTWLINAPRFAPRGQSSGAPVQPSHGRSGWDKAVRS